ncbi:MAG: hypothetical protein ACUVXA_14130 [Candidatus Jordarchaeum sp.]
MKLKKNPPPQLYGKKEATLMRRTNTFQLTPTHGQKQTLFKVAHNRSRI